MNNRVARTPALRAYGVLGILLFTLGGIWGGSFVLQRIAAAPFGAFPLVFVRLTFGAIALAPFLWKARHQFSRGMWPRLAIVGLLTSAVPFALFAWGAERAPAAVGAITNSLTAPFSALVGWLLFREHISALRLSGIVVGFCGVLILVGIRFESGTSVAALAGTLASLCYGIGGQWVSRSFPSVSPPAIAAATLGTGALLFAVPAFVEWPKTPLTGTVWACGITVGILCTGIAYGLYFWLISRLGAAGAATVTYLIPLFAVVLGWAFLDEQPSSRILVGGAVIIAGVVMTQAGGAVRRSNST